MISKDLLFDLYDKCLGSLDAPFCALSEEVVKIANVGAASLWMENIGAPGALARLGFHSNIKQDELPQEDHRIALRVHKSQGEINGTASLPKGTALSYWGVPVVSGRAQLTLVFWSTKSFSPEELERFHGLLAYIEKLVDVVFSSDLFGDRRVTRELQTAQLVQRQLMPKLKNSKPHSSLAFRSLPAHELGGDYIDVLSFPKGIVGLTLADAMGSGVPAALVALMARTIFRQLTKSTASPSQVLSDLNKAFMSEIVHLNTFVTQFYGVFEPTTQRLLYSNAGHVSPLLFRKETGEVAPLPSKGVALGVKADAEYPAFAVQLQAGDILVIYSDGLADTRNEQNEQFGAEGIARTLLNYQEYDADGICDGLIHDMFKHSPTQQDDVSMIVIKP
ncbi:MAG: serine/threonine-protein phosphatase [Firmicutes bacterium]|nr:serine/threonine-protein phosphatase [Bacillota bacterium]